ncbi:substrate-binding domain-containing protein [Clostridium sp. DL1XJH146]
MNQLKNKRRLTITSIIILIILISVIGLKFFKDNKNELVKADTEDDRTMIGISIDGMVIERWQKDVDILKSKAEELNYRVEVLNAYEDAKKQENQIKSLVEEGAEVIIIIAYDKNTLQDVVKEAKRKGVIVIAYDRLIMNANVDAYVSFDNIAVGEYMAKALVDKVPKGNYVIINGSPKDNNSLMFTKGYYNILDPYILNGDIKIVKEVWAENWREEFAYDTISDLLKEGVEIDAIIGANDRLAEGAISILSEYGLAGEVPVVGHDADISACQKIVEHKQLMTVYKPIKNLAEGTIDVAVELLENRQLEYNETIYDGTYEVPYVKFDVIPVDANNMKETVVADLFHSEEDIYRNNKE